MDPKRKPIPAKKEVTLGPIKVDRELADAVREKSERTGISRSFVQREALKKWVEEETESSGVRK